MYDKVLSGELEIKEGALLPFLSRDKVDQLFLKAFNEREEDTNDYFIYLPFISKEVLSNLVDEYIKGREDIPIDKLYPFMDHVDIKRLFNHALNKKTNQEKQS